MVAIFGLLFLASLFLNLGMLLLTGMSSFYFQRAEVLNGAHSIIIMHRSGYELSDRQFFERYPGAVQVETENVKFIPSAGFDYAGSVMNRDLVIADFNFSRNISKVRFIGSHLEPCRDSVYLPYALQAGGEYELGGDFRLSYDGRTYSFIIAGFLEDVTLASLEVYSGMNIFLPYGSYMNFSGEINNPHLEAVRISARYTRPALGDAAITDYIGTAFSESAPREYILLSESIYDIARQRTMIAELIAMIFVAFAILIAAVCLIVVRFRIVVAIQDGMTNIGALKAIGYVSAKIIAAFASQFAVTAAAAGALGITVSYIIAPELSSVFADSTGLIWKTGFDFNVTPLCFFAIFAAVLAVSVAAASSISALQPIDALRGYTASAGGSANHLPLTKTRLNINIALAFKSLLRSMKQNVTIAVIISASSFTVMLAVVLFYNFAVDYSEFLKAVGDEPSNVYAIVDTYSTTTLEQVEQMPQVRKAFYSSDEYDTTTNDSEKIGFFIMEDFSLTERSMLIEGKYPVSANEVLFPAILAKQMNRKVGDPVSIRLGRGEADYIISGFSQSTDMGGRMGGMTLDGIRRLQKNYSPDLIHIYLHPHEDEAAFINALRAELGDTVISTFNVRADRDNYMAEYISLVSSLAVVISVATTLVVGLVLYLIIKTDISRKNREIGIKKAVGYTTFQIMWQIAMCFMPVVAIGALVGAILGYYYINDALGMILRAVGIMRINFIVMPEWAGLTVCALTAFSYAVSMSIAWKIRKVSPYMLAAD
jgi:putative ABC transport system permease protein